MITPPIDKLLDMSGCKYALVCLLSKRARTLLDKRDDSVETSARAVSKAANEIYDGKIVAKVDTF
ncbi:MAG: DNA-directed RNA polymerase subunit omega [Firmicutes bacterium]|nr:DNA-directed RNA polymerase subunit omega [Bacillota bacterium]